MELASRQKASEDKASGKIYAKISENLAKAMEMSVCVRSDDPTLSEG
jgi:hypothetical protein